MPQDNINTAVLQQFINQVKAADIGRQKEVKLDINTAKNLAYTLGTAMARLAGDYEGLLRKQSSEDTVISVNMDGGNWEEQR
jgi:hypothetical protein